MKFYNVKLNSIEKVKEFVTAISKNEGHFEFVVGNYVVDAKSIMGIFSLDLTQALTLRTESLEFPSELTPFLV